MISLINKNFVDMSPIEFELFIKNLLESANEKLHNLQIMHNEKIKNDDGTYQIDITVRFTAFGGDFLLLIECKQHKNPIKRDTVQILHDKIRTIGAQKGMIFSTTGFQKGAVQYATKHGIALVQVANESTSYLTRSLRDFTHKSVSNNSSTYIGWFLEYKEKDIIKISSISRERTDTLLKFLER